MTAKKTCDCKKRGTRAPRAPLYIRLCFKIGVVDNKWLVGNAVFSETSLRIFLIFCMKLGYYKGRKVTEPDYWKKILIWRYSSKGLQISPKSDTDVFLKNSSNDFFDFWPEISTKYDLQFEWNLFFRKIYNLEISDPEIVKKLPKLKFLNIFSTLHH